MITSSVDVHSANPALDTHPLRTAPLDTITLDDLNEVAALDSRIDRKYIVDARQVEAMVDGLGDRLELLEIGGRRAFRYESSYFDTPSLDAYRGSALDESDRLKVRTRTYRDLERTKIEVKVKDAFGVTRKFRQDHPYEMRRSLTDDSRWFVESISPRMGHAALLVPVITTSYRRATLVDRRAAARMTVDAGLRCVDCDGRAVEMPEHYIVEVKSSSGLSHMDQWLWRSGLEPVEISKFATGLAALNPQLPAEKWRTVLQHYLRPAPPARVSSLS